MSGCGNYSCSSPSISYVSSGLESVVGSYSSNNISYSAVETQEYTQIVTIDSKAEFIPQYLETSSTPSYMNNSQAQSYMLSPDYQSRATQVLLAPNRNSTPVIDNSDEIMNYITEAFEKTTGREFPTDIIIKICAEAEMALHHKEFGGQWTPNILGFAINNEGKRKNNLVFVKKNNLDALMLTIGHELGHVLTQRLPDQRDEEAKAFAFELAWMESIKEHNIANLENQFINTINPAKNGLHNVAFDFVVSTMKEGISAFDIFKQLFSKDISISS